MAEMYIDVGGTVVEPTELTHRGAIATASAAHGQFAAIVECRKSETSETVIFDVEVERPQTPVNDIRASERIAAVFSLEDDKLPEALVLRRDFPNVPHLNLSDKELPRSLCLYDEVWTELKRSWTGGSFIERIRWWLRLTARGELHGEDQPLEPLLFSHGFDLVVPSQFGTIDGLMALPARISLVGGTQGRVIVCSNPNAVDLGGVHSYVMYIDTPPRAHGVIRHTPRTIADIAALVDSDGFSLLSHMRDALLSIPENIRLNPEIRRKVKPVFVLGLPKRRKDNGKIESREEKAFISIDGIESIGEAIGAWVVHEGTLASILGENNTDGSSASVVVANVVHELSPTQAAAHSGLEHRDERRIVAIGMGALGSQVALNLARSGSGDWTLIDDDAFMPHNAVRHALEGGAVIGHNKAECVAAYMNSITPSEGIARFLPANYLKPGDHSESVVKATEDSDLVLDMSASVALARELSDEDRDSRAVSLFLAPSGQDLVMLAEDTKRQLRLDDLEMLYYRAVVNDPELAGHLEVDDSMMRYGASCRDVSVLISQTSVGTLAGIGSAAIQQTHEDKGAAIRVWRMHPRTQSVSVIDVELDDFVEVNQYGWRVRLSRELFAVMLARREDRLPNETGGILIGGVDHARRCLHIVEAIGSPPDSEEWPTMYIRGVEGLQAERERIVTATAGNLDYLGEWHSHPRGASTRPSKDDAKVFGWICKLAADEDRPGIMLIIGENEVRMFVEEFEPLTEPICLT